METGAKARVDVVNGTITDVTVSSGGKDIVTVLLI